MERGRGTDYYVTEFQGSGCVGVISPHMHRYYTMGCITKFWPSHPKAISSKNKGFRGEVRFKNKQEEQAKPDVSFLETKSLQMQGSSGVSHPMFTK